jgi:hypothetical protein
MHGSRSKISSKKSRQAALLDGFNSGVKGLMKLTTFTHYQLKIQARCLSGDSTLKKGRASPQQQIGVGRGF